ncbi:CLUMA_CG021544, isoform A [Clunio marinus]|uniref:CLUMA_CG021544, isoform A n=1 Tax=Clunio marinus TaxID=568069 RepID=A0A1J1J903_9DIPT|nr:CLUMA_CG021544, isoform A [Clunio marinus]
MLCVSQHNNVNWVVTTVIMNEVRQFTMLDETESFLTSRIFMRNVYGNWLLELVFREFPRW